MVEGAAGSPSASGRSRSQPHHRELPRARCVIRRASRSRWSAAAGSSAAPGPTTAAAATNSCRCRWDKALDLLGAELRRVRDTHGPGAVFGGSYGWASAGRFHHAQSQIHRFLNTALGGYVRSVNSYSSGASSVILPHVLGDYEDLTKRNVTWEQMAEHTEIVLAFGGMALKNSMVAGGSVSKHVERGAMDRAPRARLRVRPGRPAARATCPTRPAPNGSAASPAPTPR